MIRLLLLLALLCGVFPNCVQDGGTEIPNELVGKELIAGKGPAANAEIKLVPVGYVPGAPGADSGKGALVSGTTDAQGRFTFKDLAPGQYNLIASKDSLHSFRDSLTITGKGQDLATDTLRAPGSLYGTIELEPNHDPRTAMVQVLGTTIFVNVDRDGHFLLQALGAGIYRLRVSTILEGYVPLFQEAAVHSGKTDTLPTLRPFYSGTPVVTGILATANNDGTVKVKWNRTAYGNAEGYLLYRDSSGTLLPSPVPFARMSDTFFVDSVYSKTPRAGQYDYLDTTTRVFTYRVRILDRSGNPGPGFGSSSVTAYPPGKLFASGQWHQALAAAPFAKRNGALLVPFQGKLWLIGGTGSSNLYKDIWSSSDGLNWNRVIDSIPLPESYIGYKAVVFQNKIWLLGNHYVMDHYEAFLYTTGDGLIWTRVSDSLPIVQRFGCSFAVYADRLWILDGADLPAKLDFSDIESSPDGLVWTPSALPGYQGSYDEGVASFAGSLWRIGGGSGVTNTFLHDVWKTSDGKTWERAADSSELLLRYGHILVASPSRLFSLGGFKAVRNADHLYDYTDASDELWASTDGTDWALVDSHAPFGKRNQYSAAYLNGRIWVIGGSLPNSGNSLNDVWYMEAP